MATARYIQPQADQSSPFFLRKASLIVGDNSTGIDLSELQFQFNVKMADLTHPQYATFRVFNISPATMHEIQAHEYRRIVFQAGYQNGAFGPIFDGEVVQGIRGRESAVDTYLDILAAVGLSAFQAGMNMTLAAGSTATDVAKGASAAMSSHLNDYSMGSDARMPRGQVCYGPASEILTDAATGIAARWFFDRKGITLADSKKPIPGGPIVLNATTGMIGWPTMTQEGVRVRCLLNPDMAVGRVIQLNNDSIIQAQIDASTTFVNTLPGLNSDGLYRVLTFEHSGDTRGSPWYTDVIGISVNETASGGITSLYQRGLT